MLENKVKKGDIVALKVKRSGATFVNFERSAGYVEYILARVEAAKRDGALKQAWTPTRIFRAGDWAECYTIPAAHQTDARLVLEAKPEPWGNLEDLKTALTCSHVDFDEDQNGNTQCRRCGLKIEATPEPGEDPAKAE